MSKSLTVLVFSMEGVGHVNACIGLSEALQTRGHKIVFVVDQAFKGKLSHYGFEEELLENKKTENMKPGEDGANKMRESGLLSSMSSYKKLEAMLKNKDMFNHLLDKLIADEPKFTAIVAKHNPDVILMDTFIAPPALVYSGKPWVSIFSANPLIAYSSEALPPPFSGYPSNGDNSDSEWKAFRELFKNMFLSPKARYYEWLKENGFPNMDNKSGLPESPYLNIYGYPQELDYTDIVAIPDKWYRVDSFMRKGEQEFKLPEQLTKTEGKLIYLSLGSMGSIDYELMQRLVQILSKSKHKFIVSKGLLGDKYELADNMWGEKSVPQTKVIPYVDLVITHGGNNSVTETFSCGKPMIVCPLFGDQFDNAQRIQEKGFGVRLDPYLCSEQELLDAIDRLLNDSELKQKLSVASKRIHNSESLQKVSEVIENLVKH